MEPLPIGKTPIKPLKDKSYLIPIYFIGPGVFTTPEPKISQIVLIYTIPEGVNPVSVNAITTKFLRGTENLIKIPPNEPRCITRVNNEISIVDEKIPDVLPVIRVSISIDSTKKPVRMGLLTLTATWML